MPLGAATVFNDLVFTTLYNGVLVAPNRMTSSSGGAAVRGSTTVRLHLFTD